ncbi:hypothetical protein HMPREF9441_03533 [Paraprevotella clara YIT 11840]|uniref:O-antigen polymerase n=2 Tax=Paraprevotella clara TaxID=454154 RepID=G5SVW2_9BACT|nr:hypothetical protein HMPREF9441_03533 [Paraprevotella clara YIT 11840]
MNGFISLIKSLKPYKTEHWIILCILLYSFTGVLKYYIPSVFLNIIVTICGSGFIIIILKNKKHIHLRGMTKIIYAFLIMWSICLTFHMLFIADIRSTFVEYHGITTWILTYLGSPYFLPNLMPFILLVIYKLSYFDFKYLWRVMLLLCILYLFYYPFAFWNMVHYDWSFNMIGAEWGESGTYGDFITNSTMGIASLAPSVIMIYFKRYISSKYFNFFFVAYILSILLQSFMARRGGLVISLTYLVAAWCMYSLNDKTTSKIKMVVMAIAVVALCYVLFNNMADSLFASLIERGTEDTRESVEQGFYDDMKSTEDWLFGRGWFGQYYEPAFGIYRSSIETGYLALILRGGFLYLLPYVTVLALSFFNGYFRSKNLFCKSFALICLMQIISLYPFGWPAFNFSHLIIWLGVSVCNSSYMRKLTDNEVTKLCF